jgi:hypothetical protein
MQQGSALDSLIVLVPQDGSLYCVYLMQFRTKRYGLRESLPSGNQGIDTVYRA